MSVVAEELRRELTEVLYELQIAVLESNDQLFGPLQARAFTLQQMIDNLGGKND